MRRAAIIGRRRPRSGFIRLALAIAAMTGLDCIASVAPTCFAENAPATSAPATQPAADVTLAAQFDDHGLASLKAGVDTLSTDGQVRLRDLRYSDGGATNGEFDVKSSTFDAATRTLHLSYNWGALTVSYSCDGHQMRLTVSAANAGATPLAHIAMGLMNVQFPDTIQGTDWQNHYPIFHSRPDNFPILLADWKTARLALCCDNLNEKAIFGYQPMSKQAYELTMRFDDAPIQPGATRTASVFLRVGGADHPGWTLVADLLHQYAQKYPSTLNWTDRRPIGSAFLATSRAGYTHNPRGWLMDPQIDTDTDTGRDAFHKKMMAYEDQVLIHCKEQNAQGVIVWDLEGQQMPHATSYLADPRMLPKVAPEMDAFADEFFSRLTKAQLRTGVTIRPSRVVADDKPAPDGRQGWAQHDAPDELAEMDDKINYAQKRWGCTIFYCDSNVDFVRDEAGKILSDPPISVDVFSTLAQRHPDCLLIPEHKTDRYWAYSAPYGEFRLGITGTPEQVRIAYPSAFSVLRLVDGPDLKDQASIDALVPNLRAGDVVLFRPWWPDPQSTDIAHLYELAHPHL